ncbi:uncharacterized protein LOC142164083 [Nicotiana tabacum]|uniref:Uncharacterized protein LOC142164083 n=1 Tax=Nicotiana tabacum TaxID=4097 RepID=A0AC58RX96_TOBAC
MTATRKLTYSAGSQSTKQTMVDVVKGLPIQCWIEKKLGRIASLLGKPICTDKLTVRCERISYARVLIEMDITQPFPDELSIEKADGSIWEQKADFEWKPKFCMDCDQFGHNTDACE